ncbi:glycosyltransferase family 4 protein [Streptomyces odontomachi]|uniref:glycosyltransferase family 4 protein n=1 Tax=Streptomyces odontomachi TaxID=2944940 RepID=UPI0027E3586A|nr:glycosyltransferase family 4 protein [Streptomyces sp. ODS25]
MSSHAPHGQSPLCTVQVLGEGGAGVGCHVRSLTAGLVARGVRVTVCAPSTAEQTYRYTAAGARHVVVADRNDPASVAALRTACLGADLVHAHGLNAGLRTALALSGRRVPLVVTWHTHPQPGAARAPVLRLLERQAARAAAVLLGATPALVDRARARGARDARLAAVAPPAQRRPTAADGPCGPGSAQKTRAELGAVDRPLLVAQGALEAHLGYGVLLDAARTWRGLDPAPLLVIAGDGPLRSRLQHRIDAEQLPVRLLGGHADLSELLAAADLAVLPAGAGGRPGPVRDALHARVPLVAADCGGLAELVGEAAALVPCDDAAALAGAVAKLLSDPERRRLLVGKGEEQAATWPTEDQTVAQVLSIYDELTQSREPLEPPRS